MTRALFVTIVLLGAAGPLQSCGSSDGPYAVDVTVTGSVAAFSNYMVMVGTKQVPWTGGQMGFVELCTQSSQKFLDAPIPLAVEQNGVAINSSSFQRYACKLTDHGGHVEYDNLFLQDDGTLLSDLTAGDVRVWASCSSEGFESACSGDDL
jgi:hypothetical protein